MTRKTSVSKTLIHLCALALAVSLGLSAPAGAAALRIVDKSFDPDTGTLSYTLRNDGVETVTAWRLSVAHGDSSGVGQRSRFDHDYYMNVGQASASQEIVARGPLESGQKLNAELHLDAPDDGLGLSALSIRVVAAIFESGGFEGERESADTLFEARALRVEEIGKLTETLRAANLDKAAAADRAELLTRHAERLRAAAHDEKDREGLRPEVSSVLAVTRIELAEQLEKLLETAELDPTKALSVETLTANLDREVQLGRRQLRSLELNK